MAVGQAVVLLASAFIVAGQRPSFAGSRPIGYPEIVNKTTTTPSGLEDKFGEVTTQRLPIEAQGDRELVDKLSKLPKDKQPFWFINWQALEADRQKPQTYPLRPNPFLEPTLQNTNNFPTQNFNAGVANSNPGVTNSNVASAIPGNPNSGTGVQNPSWKLQDQVNTQNQDLTNKNGNPDEDKLSNTQAITPASTNTSGPQLVEAKVDSNISKLASTHPEHSEENEFEDIQVKKLVKNN